MALPTIAPYELPGPAALPAARVSWRPDRSRAALLVHDMQGYFVRRFPAEADPMRQVLANIDTLRTQCDRLGIPVFYTAQPGRQDPRERGLQSAFWGPGMSSAPDDQHIVAALTPRPHHTVLTKWRYSAFQRSDFEERLRRLGRDQLLVTGVFAHIGCLITAADAFMRDVEPFIVADAVADFSREHHDRALVQAAACCAVPLPAAQVAGTLDSSREPAGKKP
jgi:bifunctional isochorismate lyase/aryl carrier protein